jgi:hypothetical protein
MIRLKQDANIFLEQGIIAEMQSKLDRKARTDPKAFRSALGKLKELRSSMNELDKAIAALQLADSRCRNLPIGAQTIGKILAQEPALPRLSRQGVRYADAAGVNSKEFAPITDVTTILAALKADLKILAETLDEATAGLRDALPLADKTEFSAVMLSGRNAFGDKMPQFTQMFVAYESFYVRTVGVTVTATMQLYPTGYDWLTSGPPGGPTKK